MIPMTSEYYPTTSPVSIFAIGMAAMAKHTLAISRSKGFYPDPAKVNDIEQIMLVVTELAEGVEGLRKGNIMDDHLPDRRMVEVEMADAVIRIMNLCELRGWDLPGAIQAKTEYNAKRPHMHGGKTV